MTIEWKRKDNELVLEVSGRLDVTTAPVLDKAVGEIEKDIQSLIFDFKDLEYISSAGLRVLLIAQKKMQQVGSMRLRNVCGEIMDVLEMTGFADILTIV